MLTFDSGDVGRGLQDADPDRAAVLLCSDQAVVQAVRGKELRLAEAVEPAADGAMQPAAGGDGV